MAPLCFPNVCYLQAISQAIVLRPDLQVMAFQLAFWGVLILRSLILPVAIQASRPLRAPAQLVNKLDGTPYNGSAVPGDSPVKYHNDPRNDLFKIEKLEMHPNPCVM